MNAPRKTCAECGAELADDAVRGLCPRCLLQAGLGSQTDPNATVANAGGAGHRRTLPDVGGGSARITSSACWAGAAWAWFTKPKSRIRDGALR